MNFCNFCNWSWPIGWSFETFCNCWNLSFSIWIVPLLMFHNLVECYYLHYNHNQGTQKTMSHCKGSTSQNSTMKCVFSSYNILNLKWSMSFISCNEYKDSSIYKFSL
jgi:hypothetical protein